MLIMACRKYYGMQYKELAEYLPFTPNMLMRHYHSGVAMVRTDSEYEKLWSLVGGYLLRNIQRRRLDNV